MDGDRRLYKWVRVDVACLTGDGAVVGLGLWPVPDIFRALAEARFIEDIRQAVAEWFEHHEGVGVTSDLRYVKCTEAYATAQLHKMLIRRWGQRPPQSAAQIWPHPHALPLPEEVCRGER